MRIRHSLFFFFLIFSFANALTCTSNTGNVNWTTAATWSCGRVPTNVDNVIIPNASTVTLNAASSIASLNVQNGGRLNLTLANNAMPTVSGTKTFGSTSTVSYQGNNNQNVTAETYGNLILTRTNGNRTRTPLAGTHTIVGNFTINTNVTWRGQANNPTVFIGGDLTRTGTLTSGTGTYTFNGNTTQTFTSNNTTTITNVVISNTSAQGLVLSRTQTFTNLTISANSTLTIAGTTTAFPTNTTRNINASSTVRFAGTGNQTIPAYTYGNIVTATGAEKRPAAGIHTLAGSLTVEAPSTYACNTSDPSVNIAGDVTVEGTFHAGTGAISITGNLNILNGAVLNLERTGDAMPAVGGIKNFGSSSTVTYLANNNQNVSAENYGNLTLSRTNGARQRIPLAGTHTITGTFTIGNGIAWQGATNNPTLNIAGNIVLDGSFSSGSGLHVFNGTTTQTISSSITIADVLITNSSSQGLTLTAAHTFSNLSIAANGVMSLVGTVTPFPTLTTYNFHPDSTVRFAGSGTRTIPAYTWGNLVTATGGSKIPEGTNQKILGDLIIGASTTWAGNTNNPDVEIAGDLLRTGSFASGNGTYTFNGSTTQTISGTVTITNVVVSNTSTNGLQITETHTFTNFTLNPDAVITLAGSTTSFPTNTTRNLSPTSSVRFMGSGNQSIPAAGYTYGNLETGTGGIKTVGTAGGQTINIVGNLIVGVSTTWDGTTRNPNVNIGGNLTQSGTFNSGSGVYTFNGNKVQTLTGLTTFSHLNINNSAPLPDPVLVLNNDITVLNTLQFTFGGYVTGNNKIILPSGAITSGASPSAGWVIGNLQKFIPAGSSNTTFEVGTLGTSAPQLAYTPATFSFSGVSGAGGSVVVSSAVGDHSQIGSSGLNANLSVNRIWSITTSNVSGTPLPSYTNYDVTLNFVAADLDGGATTSNFFVTHWEGSDWNAATTGIRSATSTQGTSFTTLGEFAIGEPVPLSITKVSVVLSDPSNGSVNPKRIPGAILQYTIVVSAPANTVANYSQVIITEPLDNNLDYTPGSLVINGIGEDDDSVNGGTSNPDIGNYNSTTETVSVNMGTLAEGSSKEFKFLTTIN